MKEAVLTGTDSGKDTPATTTPATDEDANVGTGSEGAAQTPATNETGSNAAGQKAENEAPKADTDQTVVKTDNEAAEADKPETPAPNVPVPDINSKDTADNEQTNSNDTLVKETSLPKSSKMATQMFNATAVDDTTGANVTTDVPTPESDFTFDDSNGELTIWGYTGTATNIVIPDTINGMDVTIIGTNAFANQTALQSVVLPKHLKEIGLSAFYNTPNLTSIVIPDSVTTIDTSAFGQKAPTSADSPSVGLQSVVLGKGLISISDRAFTYNSLTTISIPENVTSIEAYAFWGNDLTTDLNSREYLTIPANVTTIGDCAFGYNENLTGVKVEGNIVNAGSGIFSYDGLESFYSVTPLYNNIQSNGILPLATHGHIHLDPNIMSVQVANATGLSVYVTSTDNVKFSDNEYTLPADNADGTNISHFITNIVYYDATGQMILQRTWAIGL